MTKGLLLLCIIVLALLLPVFSALSYATCPEANSVQKAIAARNRKIEDVYNRSMGNAPEENREAIGSCLDNVFSLGDLFSMDISIPGMDEIIESMCAQANSKIQEKIQQTLETVKETAEDVTGPFEVNASASSISNSLIGKIK